MKGLLTILFYIVPFFLFSQSNLPGDTIYELQEVQELPIIPGGDAGLVKYLMENIKYSKNTDTKIVSSCKISFVIHKDGTSGNVTITPSVDKKTDKSIVRAIEKMQKCQPGKVNGKSVNVRIRIPLRVCYK